jgi:hypothetical protein
VLLPCKVVVVDGPQWIVLQVAKMDVVLKKAVRARQILQQVCLPGWGLQQRQQQRQQCEEV